MSDVTQILSQIEAGEAGAAERLLPLAATGSNQVQVRNLAGSWLPAAITTTVRRVNPPSGTWTPATCTGRRLAMPGVLEAQPSALTAS